MSIENWSKNLPLNTHHAYAVAVIDSKKYGHCQVFVPGFSKNESDHPSVDALDNRNELYTHIPKSETPFFDSDNNDCSYELTDQAEHLDPA